MAMKRWSAYLITAWMYVAWVLLPNAAARAAVAPKPATIDSIVRGAKQEGKLSWTSNLEGEEVIELHKAFQKEYPFIKINYGRVRGGEQRQRVLSEMQAGIFPYDLMSIEEEMVDEFQKLGFLIDPIDWHRLFGIDARMVHPKGFLVSVGNNPAGIYYNKNLVPKDRVPKTWADCYNPYFRGKFSADVRPAHMLSVMYGYGEDWTLDYAKKLLANKPKWMRGNALAVTMVAAGEVLLSCPASHGSWYRASQGKPGYPVGFVYPEGPVVAGRELLLSPLKGAANPNAALLMTGWIAGKGVKYLRTGRESIFHPETELGAEVKRMGREIKVTSWDVAIKAEELMRKILEVWGFPKPERSGG
ncbi:MAG: extracellular solute-binding protein [Deltaproteobacteria bacterium]|nr:extracellular solute-binding protein [Deltaproteobacteria bacterium]